MRFKMLQRALILGSLLTCAGAVFDSAQADAENEMEDLRPISEWQSFREDELKQLERRRADARRFSKFSVDSLEALAPLVEPVRLSAAECLDGTGKRISLGTVVGGSHVLTKASEVASVAEGLQCRFKGGITVAAEIVDMFAPYDLALVKVKAKGLRPISWEAVPRELVLGTMLGSVSIDRHPVSFGVLSVNTRSLNPGFLGVQLVESPDGPMVARIIKGSAAAGAGVQPRDIIVKVEDVPITSRDQLIALIKRYTPGDETTISVLREGEEVTLNAVLGSRHAILGHFDPNHEMLAKMQVPLSRNRTGYPSAIEHDSPLSPDACGGPLIDLQGRVVGMNIARAGRIRTLAIPASDIVPLLREVDEDRFFIPDPDELKTELNAAKDAVEVAKSALSEAKKHEVTIERALENLKKYRLPNEGENGGEDEPAEQAADSKETEEANGEDVSEKEEPE